MIYDIYVENDDKDYRDVRLDMALEDYTEDTYSVVLTLDRDYGTRCLGGVLYGAGDKFFVELNKNDVPEWVKRLTITLTPRMHEVMSDYMNKPITRFMDE